MVLSVRADEAQVTEAQVAELAAAVADELEPAGKRIVVLIPDLTRTCPLGLVFATLYDRLAPAAARFDCLIALGTHGPMSDDQICRRLGVKPGQLGKRFPKLRVFNHRWNDPAALAKVGQFDERQIDELTEGLFKCKVDVTVNRMVLDYDVLLIVGPVYPHEVVGFSGGNKYIFPGISGPELLNFFHWLSAVITNPVIIGRKWTPVRRVIDRAAAMVPVRRYAVCMVTEGEGLAGLFAGETEEAWSEAADLAAQVHIRWTDRPYHLVLSQAPPMYEDLWLAGKCMYKLEPVVADGGTLIIYAPHMSELSHSHGDTIRAVGYHVRDFFLKQWDKYRDYPWGVLAHCTHVKGIGRYESGREEPRINVVLATKLPEALCRQVNLGYKDPSEINPAEYANREAEGVLYVPRAGEVLYRLRNAPPELGGTA